MAERKGDEKNSGNAVASGESAESEASVRHQEAPSLADLITEPRNLNGDINMNLKWYVVHTYSGFEEKAKQSLFKKANEKGLSHLVGAVHIPHTEKETKTKTGKARVISKTSFPGYMMLQLELNDVSKVLVKETPKITGFVGDNKNPKALPDHEVRAMLAIEVPEVESERPIEHAVLFNKGDAVKVTDGPFSNFDGVVDVVRPEKGKVRVLVSIFGRETPVELEYRQVEQI